MSKVSDVNPIAYSAFVQPVTPVHESQGQAKFTDYLKDTEKSAVSGQSAAVSAIAQPVITGLLSGSEAIVRAEEPEVDEDQSSSNAATKDTAREKFREYMEMTPEERFFVAMLEKKGYTKEQYDALPAEEKLKIQKEIEEEAKKKTEQKVITGAVGEATVQETSVQNNTPVSAVADSRYSGKAERDKALDWL